jgi:WD40 repeat protein/energy-coupling factor transporter ATP-binding protein EcfA2
MKQSIVINFGIGDLDRGFLRITVQKWTEGSSLREQYTGSLPAAPHLVKIYQSWQNIYQHLCSRFVVLSPTDEEQELDNGIEIVEGGITNISQSSFEDLCQQLQQSFNLWLKSENFRSVEMLLRTHLYPTDEIQIVIETDNNFVQRLPWHRWEFLQDYLQAEVALSNPEYRHHRSVPAPIFSRSQVRILAIFGSYQGLNLDTEQKFLMSLDAETQCLVNPSRQEFDTALWDTTGWDILFFAGHSQTEGRSGRIYINNLPTDTDRSLTIEQLEEALKAAIGKGLQIAIFNSCDGLGLAQALARLQLPVGIVMQEPVPNRVAQEFFIYFLEAYAQEHLSLYLSVRQARRKLQGLENNFPGASWLPVIYQNPAVEAPLWRQMGGIAACPYRGLAAFREGDADLFFGREKFIENLANTISKNPLVAVVGPSGSGKSSLVFAGLVPKLKGSISPLHTLLVLDFRPGTNPFSTLATTLASSGKVETDRSDPIEMLLRQDETALTKIIEKFIQQSDYSHVVLIADQFEELYTTCPQIDRQLFLQLLLHAVKSAPQFTMVLTLRADFYGYAIAERAWSDALQGAVLNLSPMNQAELQEAITKPAAYQRVSFEAGLIDVLIQETTDNPGHLPLLQFALTQLWYKQQEGVLTHQGYQEIGGVGKALANYAETVYSQLEDTDRAGAQRIFMQLVRLGEENAATRRLAALEEISPDLRGLVTHLADCRLVVTNRSESGTETVEIVHEALIKRWERLDRWLEADEDFHRWLDQLRNALKIWESNDRDEGALLRGKPLTDAEEWLNQRATDLGVAEQNFVQISMTLRDQQMRQGQRQLRLLQFLLGSVSAALLVSVVLGVTTFIQSQNATSSQIEEIGTSADSLYSLDQHLDSLVRSIEAQKRLSLISFPSVDLRTKIDSVLRQAMYSIDEINRLPGSKVVAFSPDGGSIATTNDSNGILLLRPDGKKIYSFTGHSAAIWGLAFDPQGEFLASSSEDKSVKLWYIHRTAKDPAQTLNEHRLTVRSVAFSPDGQLLASASDDKTVKLWKRDGKLLQTLTNHNAPVWNLAFSPDGQTLASVGYDKKIRLWRVAADRLVPFQTLEGHKDFIIGVAFSPDGKWLASASHDKTVKLWRRESKSPQRIEQLAKFANKPIITVAHSAVVSKVAFSPDSRSLVSVSWDKTVKQWGLDGSLLKVFNGHTQRVWDVAFSPKGDSLATASEAESKIRLWRLQNPLSKILRGHKDVVLQAIFSPDGQTIASSSDDRSIKIWKPNGTLIATLNGHQAGVLGIAFSQDGQTLASASWDGTVKLWQVNPASRKYSLLKTVLGKSGGVWKVAFTGDGTQVAFTGGDGSIKIWSKEGGLITSQKQHNGEVRSIAFSPDSKLIISGSVDKTIKLWSPDGRIIRTLTGHTNSVWSVAADPNPNSHKFASGGADKTIRIWQENGKLLQTITGHRSEVRGLAFSPDGQRLASASADGTIKLWQYNNDKDRFSLKVTLPGHKKLVWSVAFSPDGKKLISASEDGTAKIWDIDSSLNPNNLTKTGCKWIHDYLRYGVDVDPKYRHLCDS